MRFSHGDPLPGFRCQTATGTPFDLDSLAGERMLLVFLGSAAAAAARPLLDAVRASLPVLEERRLHVFLVSFDPRDRDPAWLGSLDPSLTVLWDGEREIFGRFGLETEAPASGKASHRILRVGACVVTENLRFRGFIPASPATDLAERLRAAASALPPPETARPAPRHAPVLQIPDVFEPELCRQLIAGYEAAGGTESGFMRDEGGMTRGVLDPRRKRRRDCMVDNPALREAVRRALVDRVAPEIAKAFAFRASRIERYLVACYDAADRGFFRAHRDNVSRATRHRRFALSVNLNAGGPEDGPLAADGFAGGALCFPEFGPATYTPRPGEAVVFSCSLLHAALPVTRGRRFVFLTFFYDEEAARIRQENRPFLDTESTDRAGGNARRIVAAAPDAPAELSEGDAARPPQPASPAAGVARSVEPRAVPAP